MFFLNYIGLLSGVIFSWFIQYWQQSSEVAVPQLCSGYIRAFCGDHFTPPSPHSAGVWAGALRSPGSGYFYTGESQPDVKVVWSPSRMAVWDAHCPMTSTEEHQGVFGRDVYLYWTCAMNILSQRVCFLVWAEFGVCFEQCSLKNSEITDISNNQYYSSIYFIHAKECMYICFIYV